ncbi:MAG: winged helix DNA-binding protein [Rhodospirillales bacterium]|nr:winged helix DNA-binding protein [Rhodospirillales bacterium]
MVSDKEVGPIVSSAHLMSEQSPELSEFEFALTIVNNGFQRWMVRCMAAAGIADLSPTDILVLHKLNQQNRDKKLADICLVLNIEDTHVAIYAIKKLTKIGLVTARKVGKENYFSTTKKGEKACDAYRQIRERCLISVLKPYGLANTDIGELAGLMRALSGMYDQAARAAASL